MLATTLRITNKIVAPTLTLKVESIIKTINFVKPYLIFSSNCKLGKMHNQDGYHPFKFQLDFSNNKREIAFRMKLGLLTMFLNRFLQSPSIAGLSS
jgi:hypothetical protein